MVFISILTNKQPCSLTGGVSKSFGKGDDVW